MSRLNPFWIALTAILVGLLHVEARHPERLATEFQTIWDVGITRSVYVVGGHVDLGEYVPHRGIKLVWNPGNIWTGTVAVQSGTLFGFDYVALSNAAGDYCSAANAESQSAFGFGWTTALPDAPYVGKTLYYYSSWTNAAIIYRDGTNWFDHALARMGPGRFSNEYLYVASEIGEAGEAIEFIPHGWLDGLELFDHAPFGGYGISNYFTRMDAFLLQDGNLYNYWPAPVVSESQLVVTNVFSSWPEILGRNIRIYLPRGYAEHSWKRYPVLYMHDGLNVFQPGGPFGSWDAEISANREISQGRMREAIIVGIDQSENRLEEYTPPFDRAPMLPPGGEPSTNRGLADLYGNFVIHNVRPTVDTHYRTLNDIPNTMVMGSSMGGLVSAYLGLETNVFGAAGCLSSSFWAASNFVARIAEGSLRRLRIYQDWGTAESKTTWEPNWSVYDHFMRDGYVRNQDWIHQIGCGHTHQEWAWAARLGDAYQVLLNIVEEPNLIRLETTPPEIRRLGRVTNDIWHIEVDALAGFQYVLDCATGLAPTLWLPLTTSAVETLAWGRQLLPTASSASNAFYRVRAERP
ncbi:MAG: alpha/beta hydrolase-fold protein [Verrucomicrobia bacterium]|nr:alpha/beta hydrolase-fold protein [Verrucomicrobiota bacterium]